jgi:DNA (cytosine-5)-methyltransferase 1
MEPGGSRMIAIDLFCGAGGVSMGLHHAGFTVTGIDLKSQPRYPFKFIQGDALEADLTGADFVWASPPCQRHCALKQMHNNRCHADLIPATRQKLQAWGGPYVIENVVGAPLIHPILLCGTMFGLGCMGAELQRHRIFESNFPIKAPNCNHSKPSVIGVYGGHVRNRRRTGPADNKGQPDFSIEAGKNAMEIHWMTLSELSQAIPPAYSAFIAREWLRSRNQV